MSDYSTIYSLSAGLVSLRCSSDSVHCHKSKVYDSRHCCSIFVEKSKQCFLRDFKWNESS